MNFNRAEVMIISNRGDMQSGLWRFHLLFIFIVYKDFVPFYACMQRLFCIACTILQRSLMNACFNRIINIKLILSSYPFQLFCFAFIVRYMHTLTHINYKILIFPWAGTLKEVQKETNRARNFRVPLICGGGGMHVCTNERIALGHHPWYGDPILDTILIG